MINVPEDAEMHEQIEALSVLKFGSKVKPETN